MKSNGWIPTGPNPHGSQLPSAMTFVAEREANVKALVHGGGEPKKRVMFHWRSPVIMNQHTQSSYHSPRLCSTFGTCSLAAGWQGCDAPLALLTKALPCSMPWCVSWHHTSCQPRNTGDEAWPAYPVDLCDFHPLQRARKNKAIGD